MANWYCRIEYLKRREWFNLGTPNKAAAAARARDIFLSLQAVSWAKTIRAYKPGSQVATVGDCTVGDFISGVKANADGRPKTIEGYCKSLRKIVADIFDIGGGTSKYDYRTGGRDAWVERVHAVKLADLTADKIQGWKRHFLMRAAGDPLKERSARVSFNSFLRQAKSLFARDVIKHLSGLQLPEPLPFAGIDFEKRPSMRYKGTFDVAALIRDAQADLETSAPEQFKIFLLAVMAGLRRNEIDKLLWSSFHWGEGIIRIEATQHFRPKSEDSAGDVEVDPELMDVFRRFQARATGPFVIESSNSTRPSATYNHYRAQKEFAKLTDWLREKGVSSKTPLHSCRKEFGSQICTKHGIFAASRALRHGDIKVTAAHYLDPRERTTAGLGHFLISRETA